MPGKLLMAYEQAPQLKSALARNSILGQVQEEEEEEVVVVVQPQPQV